MRARRPAGGRRYIGEYEEKRLGPIMEWKDWIFLALGVIQTIFVALTYYRDKGQFLGGPNRWLAIIASFTILTWAGIVFDLYDRHFAAPEVISTGPYGVDGPTQTFYMQVDTSPLAKYAHDNKLMLIARFVFANVDRMTDKNIAKSVFYTIDGTVITLSAPMPAIQGVRVPSGSTIEMEHNLIMVPSKVSAESINSLGDVTTVGGKILSSQRSGTQTSIAPR